MEKKTVFIILGVVGGLLLCCGATGIVGVFFGYKALKTSADKVKRHNDLMQIGLAYHGFYDGNKRPPASVAELRQQPLSVDAVRKLEDGSIVFLYGVAPLEMSEGSTNTVLAYEKDVPTSGGYVVFGDGHVDWVTPERFKTLAQAKKKG
jgi:hypothetical protein